MIHYKNHKVFWSFFHDLVITNVNWLTTNEPFAQVKENNGIVNTFRTWNGPPKFCIDLKADWLIILDEVGGKSPFKAT